MSIETLHASLTREIRGSTNRDQRKLANNTYGRIDETVGGFNAITIRLHATDIAVITPTTARYNTGGWFTVTTKERINRWLPTPMRLYSEKGIWYVGRSGLEWRRLSRFYDGIMLHDTPEGVKVVDPQLDDPDEPLRKALDGYVKLYTDERIHELVNGSHGGDCLFCQIQAGNDDAPDGSDHLLYHIAESHTMFTLAYYAVKASGYKPDVYLGMFHGEMPRGAGMYGDTVRRSIREYLKARVLNRGLVLPDLELEDA